MKKKMNKKLMLLLVFVLLFAGCGESDPPEEPIVGNDWRVTGAYIPGTLEHGKTVNVLVGMGDQNLVIYYDKETQEAYKTVEFPYETTSVQMTSDSLAFEDLNEDGYTDLSVLIYDQQGEDYYVEFLWDAETKDFLTIAPSIGTEESSFSYTEFIGAWTNSEEGMTFVIDVNYNWEVFANGEVTVKGSATPGETKLTLYTTEDVYYCELTREGNAVFDEWGQSFEYFGPVYEWVDDGIIVLD